MGIWRKISNFSKRSALKMGNNISKAKLGDKFWLLDLPELPLESILERLSPSELCCMATLCKSLRDRCQSDYLWDKLFKQKWGQVIGDSAYRQLLYHVVASKNTRIHQNSDQERRHHSTMDLYISLTTGEFRFPAQVYNRSSVYHDGFLLSCYDAQLCYDSKTDTFQARYHNIGSGGFEENIAWDRLRIPPLDISSHVLYTPECLADLRPGDHFEIQWRRQEVFPYGWWYGVVGHLKSCVEYDNHCLCHLSDTVILEFKHFDPECRWRQTVINRKNHREEGNEEIMTGFYGGIRKLHDENEIARWKTFWPTRTLE